MTVDCMACGRILEVPEGLPEGGELACPGCRLVLRNVAAARTFRWMDQPAFLRAHGVNRFNYWGALLGSTAWVPVMLGVLAFVGRLGVVPVVFGAVYVALVVWALRRRAGTPAVLWTTLLWTIMGAFGAVLAAVLLLAPETLGLDPPVPTSSVLPVAGLSAAFLLTGVLGRWAYLRRYARVPKARVVGHAEASGGPLGA